MASLSSAAAEQGNAAANGSGGGGSGGVSKMPAPVMGRSKDDAYLLKIRADEFRAGSVMKVGELG